MQLFRPTLRTRRLVGKVAGAYADRALITSRLVLIKPPLSDIEFAVLWAMGATVMRKANDGRDQAGAVLGEVACDFYDSCCQSFVTQLLGSNLILKLDSQVILDNVDLIEEMSPIRLKVASRAFMDLSSNALILASATIESLSAGLSSTEADEAKMYAATYLARRSELNTIERSKAEEWVTDFRWHVPTS